MSTETTIRPKMERQQEIYKDMLEGVRLSRDFATDGNWLQLRKMHETLMALLIDAIRYES